MGVVVISIILTSSILNLILFQEYQENETLNIRAQSEEDYSDQWLENPSFDNPNESWFYTIQGDKSDVSGNLGDGKADFNILGGQHNAF